MWSKLQLCESIINDMLIKKSIREFIFAMLCYKNDISSSFHTHYISISDYFAADTTLPTITGCPGDITDTALPGENSLSVTWDEPQASDASGIKSFTPNIQSGFSFPTGQTIFVVYTAEDNAGNIHRCGFSVTVNAASGEWKKRKNNAMPIVRGASLPDVYVSDWCRLWRAMWERKSTKSDGKKT